MIKCKQFYDSQGHGSAARYFTEHISSSDYYLKGSGLLQGAAFEHMGLSAREIDLKIFQDLESNRHPETGVRITPKTNKMRVEWGINRVTGEREIKRVLNRKSGMDLTLVVPKTLSMVMAENQSEWGREIERICVWAKDKALGFAESLAKVSVSGSGPFAERYTGNLLFLSVIHSEAKAVGSHAADPYWHSHNYVFLVTFDPVQKRMRAVTMSGVLRFSETIDAYFISEVVKGLTKMGVGTERSADGKGFEVTSVKGKEIFSKRTFEIMMQGKQEEALVETLARAKVKEAAKLGKYLDFTKVKNNIVNGRSRLYCKKKKPIERDEQLKAWRDQMTPEIRASLGREAVLDGERRNWRTPDQAKEEVLYSTFKQDSVVHEYDIVAELLRATGGEMSFEEALPFAKGPAFIHLDTEGHVTTERVRQEERDMLARARASWDTRAPLISDTARPIGDSRVANARDQAAAVRFIWNSRDGVMDVSGLAGAGKSSLLREAIPAIRAAGHQVIILAPTSSSEKNLQADFPETITLQKFELDLKTVPGIGENFVIFLDESSMVSVPQMAKMVELVHSHGCRLITLGDVDQQRSYARGDAIRILQESGSVRSVQLTETYRAQVAYLRQSVLDLKAGGVRREIGYNRLDEHGDIRELDDVDKMRDEAVQTHLDAVRKGELAIMASPTHAEARAVADMVRKRLKAEGRIEAEDHVVTGLSTLDIEGPQLRDPVHYQPGRVLGIHSRVRGGFKSGEKWLIVGREDGGGFTVTRNGETKIFNPSTRGHWKIYDTTEMVLSVGDQVRVNEGFKQGGDTNKGRATVFKNNELARIAAIDDERITLDDGRSMSRDYVDLDQGVCITSYAAECRTVKQIVSLVPCASLPALDAKTFYVLASRATHRAIFYTDCKEALKEAALREGDRPSVFDYEKRKVPAPESRDLQPGVRKTALQRLTPLKAQVQNLMAHLGLGRHAKQQREIAIER